MLITSAQCRAARALVDMDQAVLAKTAQVTRNVIINFEKGRSTPNRNNLAAIRRALEDAGVEFINGGSPGVRLKPG
jgi:DNA-binding XRE family transcriptional regulator